MPITLTQLRADLYRMIDEVIETGQPLVIQRNGRQVLIQCTPAESKLASLVQRPSAVVGDPNDLVHMDFSGEWRP